MKGYTFYLEYDTQAQKRKGNHAGTVCAVYGEMRGVRGGVYVRDCIAAAYFQENSPVCTSSVGVDYLREKCKRISEAEARKIHPRLFERLDGKE